MAAVKTLRVQPTPSPLHPHHSHELISPSSTYPSQSFSSPSSLPHARLQAQYHHARQLQQQRIQQQLERERVLGQQRVALWDTINQRKISGFASPLQKNLHKYLELHPHCILYETYMKEKERATGGVAVERRKKAAVKAEKKVEPPSASSEDEKAVGGEEEDGSSSDGSSDTSDSSAVQSPSSSSSSAPDELLSPLPEGGKRKPSTASSPSEDSSGSGNDSDGSSENDGMKTEEEEDADSLPSARTASFQSAPTSPRPAPAALLPPFNEAPPSPPVILPPPVPNHKPPPFDLTSLPFIPRLYTPEPNPLPSDPLLVSPSSPLSFPPSSLPLLSTRNEPMSPPSPLSSNSDAFPSSESDDMLDVAELRATESDALDALDRNHAIQAGPFPLGQLSEETSTLTPMVEAMRMREAAGGGVPALRLDTADEKHQMEE